MTHTVFARTIARTTATVLLQGCLLGGSVLLAQSPAPSPAGPGMEKKAAGGSDSFFVTEAARGNLSELQLASLAQQKTSDPEIKSFAARIVEDHTKASNELGELAKQKGIPLPSYPSTDQQNDFDRLKKLSGAQFDQAYVELMLREHQKDVSAFKQEANVGQDAEVKQFAAKILPTLRGHLEQVQKLQPKAASR